MNKTKIVLSGIRATGRLHLGNYLGAVKGMLSLQNNPDYQTFYMVADAHALTTPYKVEELRVNRREVIIDYLAAGLDPEKSTLFLQSEVSQHFELAFYFSSVATVARMQHLPTFKDKVKQYPQYSTMALLNYPILMASDILVYKADLVPVGIDQEPHLEISREIARKMNTEYGLDFPEPKRFATKGEYVPSLTGNGKMSKSVEGSYINISDSFEEIRKKVSKIPTDSGKGQISLDNNKKVYQDQSGQKSLGLNSLMVLVELFMGEKVRLSLEKDYQTQGLRYGDIKGDLATAIYKELKPLQEKRQDLSQNQQYVDQVIAKGSEKAREVASKTLAQVKKQMGLS